MTNTREITENITLTETDNLLIFRMVFETEEQAFDLHKYFSEDSGWAWVVSIYEENIVTVRTDKKDSDWTIKEMIYRYEETLSMV